ncbi:MAG: nucleotidyltransferase domain-containing protein [Chloroflexota bacterium]|nr:nucleotidyltransferase domain-containing protein [Chloroflexota bacterium]MDE2920654.1 nucleotidyltransferase domain-containing protein [Chloroflexota bacterium]
MNRTSLGDTNVTTSDVQEVVRRIVEVAQPEKIILFGSAARGEMGPHSDLDILVVKSGADHWSLSGKIRRALRGVNAAVDLVVATQADIERYKDSHPLVYKPAMREGRVVYDAA